MGDTINRTIRLKGLSKNDANIEKMEALSDLVVLYNNQINIYLNKINKNKVIQSFILNELNIEVGNGLNRSKPIN